MATRENVRFHFAIWIYFYQKKKETKKWKKFFQIELFTLKIYRIYTVFPILFRWKSDEDVKYNNFHINVSG